MGGLGDERELSGRAGDASRAKGHRWQRAGSRRNGVGPHEGAEDPAARRREPKGVACVFPGTERPSARDNEVNDDTSNTVTVLIDDLDDRRRNAGRHGSALWVEGLLDEPCRRARERGRAEDYRRARQAADRRSGGLGAGARAERPDRGRDP